MAFGLRIKNAGGFVQIDDGYRNLMLREKGTLALSTSNPSFSEPIYAGVIGPKSGLTMPVLALKPDANTTCGVWYSQLASGNWSWEIDGQSVVPGGGTVDWYIFDVAPAGLPSGYGMWVKDASGNVAFHHEMKPMRVASGIVGGRTYAMAVADPAYAYTYTDLGPGFGTPGFHDYAYASEMNAVSAASAIPVRMALSNFITEFNPAFPPANQPIPPTSYGAHLLLDVTGY